MCELCRQRQCTEGLYAELHDGKLWKDLQNNGDKPFLSEPGNYRLMLNTLTFFSREILNAWEQFTW